MNKIQKDVLSTPKDNFQEARVTATQSVDWVLKHKGQISWTYRQNAPQSVLKDAER
jgi:hypothetical protein